MADLGGVQIQQVGYKIMFIYLRMYLCRPPTVNKPGMVLAMRSLCHLNSNSTDCSTGTLHSQGKSLGSRKAKRNKTMLLSKCNSNHKHP